MPTLFPDTDRYGLPQTSLNGYYYEVTDLSADPTPSGTTEPTWPTVDGATVTEFSVETDDAPASPTDPADGTTRPEDVRDRYANRFGP